MAKKSNKSGLPKRLMGIKVPKKVRKWSKTEVGAAIIAEAVVGMLVYVADSAPARRAMRRSIRSAEQLAAASAHLAADAGAAATAKGKAVANSIARRARGMGDGGVEGPAR